MLAHARFQWENKLAIRLRVFFGPRREKTCLLSFQLGHAQTNLLSYKD